MKAYQNKHILVLGLGKTGLSVLRFFHGKECVVSAYAKTITDSMRSELAQQFPYSSFYSGSLKEVLINNSFDILVLSPGFSIYRTEIQQFLKSGKKVVGDIQIWLDLVKSEQEKLIAITGSNGKSTVTDLVGFLCRHNGLDVEVAGNIGLPVLDAYLDRKGVVPDVWALELSSFQLETIDYLNADAATCLNISEDHLDRYDDLLDYAHHKAKIFAGARFQVLNADDSLCVAMKQENMITKWISTQHKTDYWLDKYENNLMEQNQFLISMRQLKIQGIHNGFNVLTALALCEAIGLNMQLMLMALPFYSGLAHRVEKIAEINGISFIDDSKGTNVGATSAALAGAPDDVILIMGGLAKGQDFSPLKRSVEKKVKTLFLIGQDAQQIAAVFESSPLPMVFCETLQEATQKAYQAATAGSWVLLSPACASMDMFKDYAHRSQVFWQTVEEIKSAARE